MKVKKKWEENSESNKIEHLRKIHEIINPVFKNTGQIDLSELDEVVSDLAYLFALVLNCTLILSEEKEERSFAADDVIPIQLEIEKNELLKYWGKVYWLSTPKDHECWRSYQDPIYIELKLTKNALKVKKILFGDYHKSDLDVDSWVSDEVEWMFELINFNEVIS